MQLLHFPKKRRCFLCNELAIASVIPDSKAVLSLYGERLSCSRHRLKTNMLISKELGDIRLKEIVILYRGQGEK